MNLKRTWNEQNDAWRGFSQVLREKQAKGISFAMLMHQTQQRQQKNYTFKDIQIVLNG